MLKTLRFVPLALIALAAPAAAQVPDTPDGKAVMAVITRMFDGMKEADSAKVRSVFVPGARFVTVGTRTNPDTVTYPAIDGWLVGIARSDKTWEERVKNLRITIDDNIASAWMDYSFYLNGAVRHCGVNSAELVKVKGEWKITQLGDSRRTTGCE